MMKHHTPLALCALLGILLFSRLPAQTATAAEAMKHPVILKYYTPEELNDFELHDTTELKSIIYYFTQSFTIVPVECSDCVPFDSLNFDIMQYEHLRLPDQTYIRTFSKYGFKLVLVPISELPYKYYIHSIPKTDPGETQTH